MHPGEPHNPGAAAARGAPRPRRAPGRWRPGAPWEERDLDRDVDPAHPYRARQLAPYRRDAGLHDSGSPAATRGWAAAAATRASTPAARARAPGPTASRTGRRC